MKVIKSSSYSAYQVHLHMALEDAVSAYKDAQEAISGEPLLSEETATPALISLTNTLERRRAAVLVLAACCVEAIANLYLAHKATPAQFAILERTKLIEKWTVLPSLFVPGYSFPKDAELYNDLKRLVARRNALVHLKEEVSRDGAIVHAGSHPDHSPDEKVFIERCQSLPDRLLAHLALFDKTEEIMNMKAILGIVRTTRALDSGVSI
jgi:hypothetical protein